MVRSVQQADVNEEEEAVIMTTRADFPITVGRPSSHEEAAAATRRAQDALDDVKQQKRNAALKPAGSDQSRQVANRAKRAGNGPWVADHRDAVLGTKRTA
jgi:hypothetical protein